MEVSYENTFDDMVALTEHQISASAAYQKRRRWTLYGSPLLLLVGLMYLGYSTHKPTLMVGGVVGALFLFFWSLRAYRNFPRKAVEKLHREKPQKEVFCRHNITVSTEGFSEQTAESRHSHTWRSLFDVAFRPITFSSMTLLQLLISFRDANLATHAFNNSMMRSREFATPSQSMKQTAGSSAINS